MVDCPNITEHFIRLATNIIINLLLTHINLLLTHINLLLTHINLLLTHINLLLTILSFQTNLLTSQQIILQILTTTIDNSIVLDQFMVEHFIQLLFAHHQINALVLFQKLDRVLLLFIFKNTANQMASI